MAELFTISGYIFAVIIAILYEYQTKNLLRKPKNKVQFYVMTNFILAFVIMLLYECKIRLIEPKNKVRFYVKADIDNIPWPYIQKKNGDLELVACNNGFKYFNLNPDDFVDMKEGEIREVFINLED